MGYVYSQIDKRNLNWFSRDITRATLLALRIRVGAIRGLASVQIDFQYPITALAGRNRSGKTTVLALAACAFHNRRTGFKLPGRKYPYYTMSDFFIQTQGEIPLEGLTVHYRILHDRWTPSPVVPDGRGPAWQVRRKPQGGRWSNYERRVGRTVVYLGIDRIVPHAEKSVLRGYRTLYRAVKAQGWEKEVRDTVGRILGVQYQSYENREHSRYRLPVVTHEGNLYSGFNMGAGEDVLFSMLSVIRECPDGALILIDEIELGLHEEAQQRLVMELKGISERRHIQIICTTHSPIILDALPPEARIFIERVHQETRIYPQITAPYAAGKLRGRPNPELDILVEDDVARMIVEAVLPAALRPRVNVMALGSATTLMRHLAVRYKEAKPPNVCVLLDGDKTRELANQLRVVLTLVEDQKLHEDARQWATARVGFLPGPEWPEAWVIKEITEITYRRLKQAFDIDVPEVNVAFEEARLAGKHNEFRRLGEAVNYEEQIVAHEVVKAALESHQAESQSIVDFVKLQLGL